MKRAAFVILLLAGPAFAGRPLFTNDPEPIDHGKWQVESGVEYARQDRLDAFATPVVLTYGLVPKLEIGVGCGALIEEHRGDSGDANYHAGFDDTALAFKWKFAEEEKAGLDLGLTGQAKIPTASRSREFGSGEFDADITAVAARKLNEQTAIFLNLGYTWLGGDPGDFIHYSAAIAYQFTPKWQPVAEVIFETPLEGKTSIGANVGIRYLLRENLMLDAAVGGRLAGDWPDATATIGFTWVF